MVQIIHSNTQQVHRANTRTTFHTLRQSPSVVPKPYVAVVFFLLPRLSHNATPATSHRTALSDGR